LQYNPNKMCCPT